MNDNDIIKALECCKNSTSEEICKEKCPYHREKHWYKCMGIMLGDALSLINRQKAEIERLKAEKDNLIKTYKECMTEAIKEFAERLKVKGFADKETGEGIVCVEDIDNLVKEMVGERE